MKKRTMKGISLSLAAVMAAGMLSGCGGNSDKSSQVDLSGEVPEKLTIFSDLGANIPAAGGIDYNDCLTFQLMEEKTGCHVEWQHPASGARSERFNIMIASGEYPDAIVYNWSTVSGGAQTYIDDEVIVDLTDYVKECMPNFSRILEENPDIKRDVMTDSGRIYSIPYLRLDKQLCVYQGPVIRQDWLEKLGLEEPKTTDELYEVLKAFKTQDPNGNGKADEIPMTGVKFNDNCGIGALLWAFGTTWGFRVKDGKVEYSPITDEFKEGLGYIAKLYSEGLIDPDYLTNDRSKVDAKFTGDISGFGFGYQPTTYYNPMNDGTRKVSGIGYLSADGKNHYCFNEAYVRQVTDYTSLAVTTANSNVAGTLKWLDEFYGGEGLMYANYGKEGLSYTMENNEPVFTDYINNNSNGKKRNEMIALTCGVRDSQFPMAQTWDFYKQTLYPWGIESIETWINDAPDTSGIMPPITRTSEETEDYVKYLNPITTYVMEEANKVITGKSDIDSWDSVVEKIKTMNIDRILEIQNDAYSRYKDR